MKKMLVVLLLAGSLAGCVDNVIRTPGSAENVATMEAIVREIASCTSIRKKAQIAIWKTYTREDSELNYQVSCTTNLEEVQ